MHTWLIDLIKSKQELIALVGSLSSLGFLFTAIFAVAQWALNERRKRQLDIQRVYSDINDRYNQYLTLALTHVRLDVADYPLENPPASYTSEELLQRRILFSMLTSLFERTFMYMTTVLGKDHPEWLGWDCWLDMWFAKPAYRAFWEASEPGQFSRTGQYLPEFESYMEQKFYASAPKRAQQAEASPLQNLSQD